MPGDFLRRTPQLTMKQFLPGRAPEGGEVDRIGADQYDRQSSADWRRRHLVMSDAAVACPDIGLIGRLGDLYKFTPLAPFAKK